MNYELDQLKDENLRVRELKEHFKARLQTCVEKNDRLKTENEILRADVRRLRRFMDEMHYNGMIGDYRHSHICETLSDMEAGE